MTPSFDNSSANDKEPGGAGEPAELGGPDEPPEPPSRSRVPLIVGAAVLAALLVAGGITAIVLLGGDGEESLDADSSPAPSSTSAAASAAADVGSDGATATVEPSGSAGDEPAPAETGPAEDPATAAPGGFDETNAIWTEEPAAWTPLPNSDWSCLGIVGNRYMSPSTNCLYNVADGHDAFYAAGMYASDAIAADPGDLPTMATLVVQDWIETEFSTAHDLTVTDLSGEWTSLGGESAAIATGRATWAATSPQPYSHADVVVVMYESAAGRFFIGIGSAPALYSGGLAELENSLLATVFV